MASAGKAESECTQTVLWFRGLLSLLFFQLIEVAPPPRCASDKPPGVEEVEPSASYQASTGAPWPALDSSDRGY